MSCFQSKRKPHQPNYFMGGNERWVMFTDIELIKNNSFLEHIEIGQFIGVDCEVHIIKVTAFN